MSDDDSLYLKWARDLGFDQDIQLPAADADGEDDYVPSVREQIDEWLDDTYSPVIDALWKEHVPESGSSAILQGELARCVIRLNGEYWKNGMMNMGDGYYDRMVDLIRETVLEGDAFTALVRDVLQADCLIVKGADYAKILGSLKSIFTQTDVEASLNRLGAVVAAWCIAHPVPIDFKPETSQ